jgi:Sporulation and spore germination.
MIEDLQDEQQPQQVKEEKPRRSKGYFLFMAFVIWLVYAAVIIGSSLPKILTAIRESGIRETIASAKEIRMAAETRYARLCFAIPKADGSASFVVCTQRINKTGASEYHDVIEGLLAGPQSEALSIGAISYIAEGSTLIGLTVSEGTVFVNLSENFKDSGSTWGSGGLEIACRQITKTLQTLDSKISKTVIMIDGDVLSL